MPDIFALRSRMTAALRDGKVNQYEAKSLISAANLGGVTAEAKNELKAQFELNKDKFDPVATALINSFLNGGTPAPTPGPATTTRRDLADPAVLTKHAATMQYAWNDTGQLFVNGVELDDVVQGSIANCYMVAGFAAVANKDPEAIKNAFKDNGDGTFTVRFYETSYSGTPKEVFITIDGQIPSGGAKYGRSRDGNELWVNLLEKAYAQWKGGYEAIGNGGSAGQVISALTGRPDDYFSTNTSYSTPDAIFTRIQTALDSGKALAAGTHGKEQEAIYAGTNLYAWHAYTLTSVSEEGGEKFVHLRNPWGRTEPGSDGKDDGSFKLPLADFLKFYSGVYSA